MVKFNKGVLNFVVFGVRVVELDKNKSDVVLLRIYVLYGYFGVESLLYLGLFFVSKLIFGK